MIYKQNKYIDFIIKVELNNIIHRHLTKRPLI